MYLATIINNYIQSTAHFEKNYYTNLINKFENQNSKLYIY